jgi:eukaryotic-like serine/threonine-protein kinase
MMNRTTPWWVLALAASFFAYFALLVYCDLWRPEDFGFEADYSANRMVLTRVAPGSPAARAGLQPNDVIESADGKLMHSLFDWTVIDTSVVFDRPIALGVGRQGRRIETSVTLRQARWSYWETGPGVFLLLTLGVQLLALVLALVIVLKRPDDAVARMGAWVLATVGVFKIVLPGRIGAVWRQLPPLVGALLWIPHVSDFAVAAVLFTFFVSFPRRSIRSPWVWAALWTPMALALIRPVQYAFDVLYAPGRATPFAYQGQILTLATAVYTVGGLTALTVNYRRLTDVNERRRVKILVIGAVGGLAPGFLLVAFYWLRSSANLTQSIFASRATALGTLGLLFFPSSFAYAILRHRLFDFSVMIRQGVRYALARRVLASLVPALAILLTADVLLHRDQPLATLLQARGWAYVVVGGLAIVARTGQRQWLSSLDRRFFREHYDAQQILRAMSEDIRRIGDFERVAPRVVAQIEAALHPEFTALLVRRPQEIAYRVLVATPAGLSPPPLRVDSTLVALLRVLGKPLEVSAGGGEWLEQQLPPEEIRLLEQSRIDLLVPIVTNAERAESVLALGVKRSEEPYTRQDIDLLAVVAANLALLLERPLPAPPPAVETFEECPACGVVYDTGAARCADDGTALVPVTLSRMLAARYHLERRLGRGGFGTVYVALDIALDRRVAVKVVRDDLPADDDLALRFKREARIAAAFVHPNVVTVHDFGVVGGTRGFLVMELLGGSTLRDQLRQHTRLTPGRTVQVMRDVCAAVDAAHRRQLVHRDLKPENIFLVDADRGAMAKVLDFGIAKLLATDAPTGAQHITRTGALIGTLAYMSPEQLRGEDAGLGCDVWALAVMSYEMLTGSHPFAVHASGRVPLERRGLPGGAGSVLGAPVQRFFDRALAMNPADRPRSSTAFLAALESALSV